MAGIKELRRFQQEALCLALLSHCFPPAALLSTAGHGTHARILERSLAEAGLSKQVTTLPSSLDFISSRYSAGSN